MIREIKSSELLTYAKRLAADKLPKKDSLEEQTLAMFIIDDPNQSINEVAFRIAHLTMSDFDSVYNIIYNLYSKKDIVYLTHENYDIYVPHKWIPGTLQNNYDRFMKIYSDYTSSIVTNVDNPIKSKSITKITKRKKNNDENKSEFSVITDIAKDMLKNATMGDDNSWQNVPIKSIKIPSHMTLEKYLELSKKAAHMIGSRRS